MEPWTWVHPPFHSALEGCGAVVALLLARLVANLERRGEGTSFNGPIVAALIGLGVLDGFHAASGVPEAAVWLRGSSTFVCGALAATAWIPRARVRSVRLGIWVALAVVAALALAAVAWSPLRPAMLDAAGSPTPAAVALNLAGGALLWIAALRLYLAWRRGGRTDDLCFCVLGSLTGGAAIVLAGSELWDGTWWLSHALRFGANAGGLWFVAFIDTRSQVKTEVASHALAELAASLEERVATRTGELRVARDAADAANRAKSEFLANMSHEIRTPLNAVIGLTEVVLRSDLDDFQRDHLQTVMESGNALVQVINDILDFSKIEAGKIELERVPLGLEDVVCEALKPLAVRAQEKGLELACLVRPEVPRLVLGDPVRIRQVVTNLVSNAITYTERGQVLVRVGVDRAASQVQLSVLDSGIGIAPEKLDLVFEPFEQADSSSTRRYGGTGLGLSICRRLVEMMGGEIRVASELGVGSVFSFTLDCPVAAGAADLAARRVEVVNALEGERVLIVDESVTERTILASMVGSAGMRPVFAPPSSDEALAQIARARAAGDPFRYAIVSANGVDEEAFAVIERIDETGARDDLTVLLLTLASPDPALRAVERFGVAARLMKPVRESDLLEVFASARDGGACAPRRAEETEADGFALPSLEILLVEDSPANQKLALAILGEGDHEVVVAGDGQQALEALRERTFDVVLMDIQMPVMDGLQATAAIRAGEGVVDPRVPIVAMTAHALPGDREECLAAGMDAYLSKPIRRGELLGALMRVSRIRNPDA